MTVVSAIKNTLETPSILYYYGARYYDPKSAVFLGVDPMSDKYPGWSPFVYCLNNPVRLIDPDGREGYEINQETGKVSKANDNQYYQKKDGSIVTVEAGKSYDGDLSDATEVDQVTNSDGDNKYYSKGTFNKERVYGKKQYFIFRDPKEAEDFYYFAANSTRVEYTFAQLGNNGGLVGSDESATNTTMPYFFESNFSNITLLSHSHTGSGGGPSVNITDEHGRQVGDLNSASQSDCNFPRQVYDVPNNYIWEYDGSTLGNKFLTTGARANGGHKRH